MTNNDKSPAVDLNWDLPDPFTIPITPKADDIDNYGHVNNAVYVGWLDACAWQHSLHVGVSKDDCDRLCRGMVVRKTQIEYIRPCFEGDQLHVGNWVTYADGRLRASRRFQILRESDGATMLRALLHYVCIDLESGRPSRWPDEFRKNYFLLETVGAVVNADGYAFQPGVDKF